MRIRFITAILFLLTVIPALFSPTLGQVPEMLYSLNEIEGSFLPLPLRDQFYKDFSSLQPMFEKKQYLQASDVLETLAEIPCHSVTRARVRMLMALAQNSMGKGPDAGDNYILAVLTDPLLMKLQTGLDEVVRQNTAKLSRLGLDAGSLSPNKLRLHCYRSFLAYAKRKPDFSLKELELVSPKLLKANQNSNLFALYHILQATLEMAVKATGSNKTISPLLASLEAKGDDFFKTGLFEKAISQYKIVLKGSPGASDIAQKAEITSRILEDAGKTKGPEGYEFAKITYLDLHTLPFPLMLAALEKYEKAQKDLEKGRFSRALEQFKVLSTYPLPAPPESKLMFSIALCSFRLKDIHGAGLAYADSVLLDKGILGADDRGILGKALSDSGNRGDFSDESETLYFQCISDLVKADQASLESKSSKLLDLAAANGLRKMTIRAMWLISMASSEKQLDRRLADARASASRAASGKNVKTPSKPGAGRPISRLAPKAGVAMRGGKVIKEVFPYGDPDPKGEPGDLNGNGKLDWEDVRLIDQVRGGTYSSLPAVLAVADMNGDGMVTETDREYAIWTVSGKPGDIDGDGTITPGEVEGFYKIYNKIQAIENMDDLYEHERMELQKEIDKYDFNKDGILSYPDYRLMVASYSRIFGPKVRK